MFNVKTMPVWQIADGAGAGAEAGAEGGSDGAGAAVAAAAAAAEGATTEWWEADGYAGDKEWLTKKNLLIGDQNEAFGKVLSGWRSAEKQLGKSADSLMDRPGEGQTMNEFMRANATVFGLPDTAEGYEMETLELPEGVNIDAGLVEGARQIAFEEGVPLGALNRFQKLYADKITGLVSDAETDMQSANIEMMQTLEADWGDQASGKIAGAQQAAQMLAEKAGLGSEGLLALAQNLKPKVGDAGTIKLFAAVADLMGEDTLNGGGGGGGGFATTPAEAKAQLAKIYLPDGDYAKASKANDQAALGPMREKIASLTKIAAGK